MDNAPELTVEEAGERIKNNLNSVTVPAIMEKIAAVEYMVRGTSTYCFIKMDNGFEVYGHAACVDPANFDAQVGKTYAHKDAFGKLWALMGFALAEKLRGEYLEAPYGRDDFGTPLIRPSEGAHNIPKVIGTPVPEGYVPLVWRDRPAS
jgi:hypothetical protein